MLCLPLIFCPKEQKKMFNRLKWRRLKYSLFKFGKVKVVLVVTIVLAILIFIGPVEIVEDTGEFILFN